MMNKEELPSHLKKYIVEQNQDKYTPIDHSVWRFILRQLVSFLSKNAHDSYQEGLKKTGITIDQIPKIDEISERLSKFGWSAMPVSGFIPPAAFMELQSLSILPIASDMRTLDHLTYTPAPDIVHEAAGHAPILADPEFSNYLKKYAEVAKKAIISKEDLKLYEAIRNLSDIKESPSATKDEIDSANKDLEEAVANISYPSEASLLSRMNWWTAEYGLIGDLENPKIYGAGLLSSVGESRSALQSSTKKIPFSIRCLDFSYDITEPQPQLFVTKSFEELSSALDEMASTMAFQRGGESSLEKVKQAQTVNTIELDSGLQISGELKDFESDYLFFTGPTQLSYKSNQLDGHGKDFHKEGFGAPIGRLKGSLKPLFKYSIRDLESAGIIEGEFSEFKFESGIKVSGKADKFLFKDEKFLLITFSNCTVSRGEKTYFQPEWGVFDMVTGSKIPSVFGGPADREAYGIYDDFIAKRVPPIQLTPEQSHLNSLYQKVRELRNSKEKPDQKEVTNILEELNEKYSKDWLLRLELLEISKNFGLAEISQSLEKQLKDISEHSPHYRDSINDGLQLADKLWM